MKRGGYFVKGVGGRKGYWKSYVARAVRRFGKVLI